VGLHVHEWGDPSAPTVVCLHGVQAHGRRFRRLAEERLSARYRVLAPDLRGHGHSTWDAPWTIERHVEDVLELVEGRSFWIGHSFGGRLVTELMARRPELVDRAVLLDPALTVPPDYAAFLAERELAADESFGTVEEAIQLTFAGLFRRPAAVLEEEVREHLVQGDDGRYRFRYSHEAVSGGYLEVAVPPPAWQKQGIPTLIVAGALSKFVSIGEVELYRTALTDRFEVVVVPGGHSVLWEAFDETADAIETFL
jgi:lipase